MRETLSFLPRLINAERSFKRYCCCDKHPRSSTALAVPRGDIAGDNLLMERAASCHLKPVLHRSELLPQSFGISRLLWCPASGRQPRGKAVCAAGKCSAELSGFLLSWLLLGCSSTVRGWERSNKKQAVPAARCMP